MEKKQQASGRLVKAAKQKQGNRKRQQSRMTKQPRRRDVAVGGGCGSSALAERVMKTKKRHQINNKREGKTTKQVRKEPNSLASTLLCI